MRPFDPFVSSSGQAPLPMGGAAPRNNLRVSGQFQQGAPLQPPPESPRPGASTFSAFLSSGGPSPFGANDLTDWMGREWEREKIRQSRLLDPSFAGPFNEIGIPKRRDFNSSTSVF